MLDKPLAVTAGEPAGIGPDLCVALAHSAFAANVVVIGDPQLLRARAEMLSLPLTLSEFGKPPVAGPAPLSIIPQALPNSQVRGTPDTANASTLLDGLRLAVAGCQQGQFRGIVTAPLQKSTINDAGIAFSGHTEFLAELTDTPMPVMLLVAKSLRVALASTHMPLSAVPGYITQPRLQAVIDVLHRDLQQKFRIDNPEIIVCGLNPHAGEGGHLGHEDNDVILPVIKRCQARGMRLRGPLPADTAFTPAGGHADAILAMYHDQGLPVLKYAGFGHAINVTLGLPIVRTSVDHGTALDLAGSGRADAGSMLAAVELALQLTA